MENKKEVSKIIYSEPLDYIPTELRKKYKLGEFAENPMLSQIKAVMLGHAVGDALGVPVEFCSREELDENPVTDMRGFGTYPVPAGTWSDDTSMSLATLDALASGTADFDEVMRNFGKWYYHDEYTATGEMVDVGSTCSSAIDNYFISHCSVDQCGLTGAESNGNGSLMRIHPFVFYAYAKRLRFQNWMEMIRKGSALTHAHERSQIGCLIYAFLLFHLLEEPSLYGVQNALARAECHLRDSSQLSHYQRLFKSDFVLLPRDAIKSSGYVVDTLEAALWCLLTTHTYCECVLKAVNLGGDTDTVAAVAGGLAGALYGYDEIPQEWLNTLQKRDAIEEMCERACKNWS